MVHPDADGLLVETGDGLLSGGFTTILQAYRASREESDVLKIIKVLFLKSTSPLLPDTL